MFPPIAGRDSLVTDGMHPLTQAYRDVVIYGDADSDEVLYEGPIVVHANGWIELEGQRLLSPHAIHHIDIYDDERSVRSEDDKTDVQGDDRRDSDERDDGYRTNRFSP